MVRYPQNSGCRGRAHPKGHCNADLGPPQTRILVGIQAALLGGADPPGTLPTASTLNKEPPYPGT